MFEAENCRSYVQVRDIETSKTYMYDAIIKVRELTATPQAANSVTTTEKTRLNQASCLLFLSGGWNRLASSSNNANAMP